MTRDFIRDFNFQSVPMEEYEVRDLFNRKQKTEIEIGDILFTQGSSSISAGHLSSADYLLRFQIQNVGNTIEERFKLELYIPAALTRSDYESEIRNYKIRDEGNVAVFSVPSSSPIYQNEITTVISGKINIRKDALSQLENPGIRLKIFYSSGIKEKTFNMLAFLTYKGKPLRDQQWTGY